MSLLVSTLLATLLTGANQGPHADNGILQELTEKGVRLGPNRAGRLPQPTMPDGLDAGGQKAVLKALAGADYDLDDLLSPSVVAPQIYKIRDVGPADREAPGRGVDVWFIAYGDLAKLAQKEVLEKRLRASAQDSRTLRVLKKADLEKRGIPVPAESDELGYSHGEVDILDKVRLRATAVVQLSRSPQSVVSAAKIDPRFNGDKEFVNDWRPIRDDDVGEQKLGPPQPYSEAAGYVKITQLAEPAGALFVEYHLVFAEPRGWFSGRNLLRSKLPVVIQSEVRSFRRELAKLREKE